MVFHVGIVAPSGCVYMIDSKTGEKYKMSVIKDDEIPFGFAKDSFQKIDELFLKLKSTIIEHFKDEIGCACVCLASFYGNEIRKKFIQSGNGHGFVKVEIINIITQTYFDAVAPVLAPGCIHRTSLFSNPYILWVIKGHGVNEWEKKKMDEKVTFIKQYQKGFSVKTMNVFGIERERIPNFIINLNPKEFDENEIKNIFPQCHVFDCANNDDGILLKALIIAEDSKVTPFDANTVLDQRFIFHDRFLEIPITEEYEPLPLQKIIPSGGTNKNAREAKIKIMSSMGLLEEGSIQLLNGDAYNLLLDIDRNGIYFAKTF